MDDFPDSIASPSIASAEKCSHYQPEHGEADFHFSSFARLCLGIALTERFLCVYKENNISIVVE
jgi:hypothetical protein